MNTFNNSDAKSCVEQAMTYIKNLNKEYEEFGYAFPVNISSCKWALEQSIINRKSSTSMSEVCMRYIDKVDYQAKLYNNI